MEALVILNIVLIIINMAFTIVQKNLHAGLGWTAALVAYILVLSERGVLS
jgi:hypothetical protein